MEPARITSPRQINPPAPLYEAVATRAHAEDTDPVTVITRYLTDYANGTLDTPRLVVVAPNGGTVPVPDPEAIQYDQQRLIKTRLTSFRIEDDIWERAQARARAERLPLSGIMNRFLRLYADHAI